MKSKLKGIVTLCIILSMLASSAWGASDLNSIQKGDLKFYSLRSVAESLGYNVKWDPTARVVRIENGQRVIELQPNFKWYTLNGDFKELSSTLMNENGSLYGSVSSMDEIFDAQISSNGIVSPADENHLSKEQLLEKAFAYDKDLRILRNQLKSKEEILNDAENTGTTVLPFTGNGATDEQISATWQAILGSRIAKDLAEKAIGNHKDVLQMQIEGLYDSLIVKNDAKELYEESLTYSQMSFSESKLKYEYGMISTVDYDKAANALQTAENNLMMQQLSIDETKASLEKLTGVPASEINIQGDVTLKPLKEFRLESAYADAVANSFTLVSLEGNVQIAKYGVDYYVFNASSPPYEVKELTVSNAKIAFDQEKDRLRQTLTTTWKEILKAEEQDRIYATQLAEKRRDLEILRTQKQLGLTTDLQFRAAWLAVEQLKLSIEQNNAAHAQLMRTLAKPWLSST